MRFVSWPDVAARFRDRTVAIVGSAPSCAQNPPGLVDAHSVVVRVNNYRLGPGPGHRCDVFYSFFGGSIRKSAEELRRDGVTLCISKVPNGKPIESEWHERTGRTQGIDFRYVYERRAAWWFCDTFVPSEDHFRSRFELLGRHIPTTGFAAVVDVLECEPARCYVTGFDFFTSGLHNVNEKWRPGREDDPIGHRPELELQWLRENANRYPLALDAELERMVRA